jgi:BirA family biotin operon repressor/biotin-[acetyl-CoA-carboxylase] ligase
MKIEQLQFIETTHSTNVTLKEKCQDYLDNWNKSFNFYGIYTNEQTQGKGLGSNKWCSTKGQNILVSFLFQPPITPQNQFYFNQYFALSIRKFLAQFVENPQIKWPNDIYVQDDKIAGILIEHNIQGERIKYSIAGVGININQTTFDQEIENPTSLKLLTGETYNTHELVQNLNNILQEEYYLLHENNLEMLNEMYLNHLYNHHIFDRYEIQGENIFAEIIGVTSFGQLMLKDLCGEPFVCNYKEIKFIHPKKEM